VALLIDLKRSRTYDLDHLLEELQLVEEVYKDNYMAGRDEVDVLDRLHDYLSSNREVMQQVFEQIDEDESGKLDVHEVCQLVGMIPGLDVSEVRYILIHLMTKRDDLNHGSKLSLDEMCAIIR
jgi:Ca2+-binding EF-hand superfamily protein